MDWNSWLGQERAGLLFVTPKWRSKLSFNARCLKPPEVQVPAGGEKPKGWPKLIGCCWSLQMLSGRAPRIQSLVGVTQKEQRSWLLLLRGSCRVSMFAGGRSGQTSKMAHVKMTSPIDKLSAEWCRDVWLSGGPNVQLPLASVHLEQGAWCFVGHSQFHRTLFQSDDGASDTMVTLCDVFLLFRAGQEVQCVGTSSRWSLSK